MRLRVFAIRFAFLLVGLLVVLNVSCQTGEAAAAIAISEAEHDLALVYVAVLEAGEVGINVSSLLGRMNTVGDLLAKAEVCYGNGNFSGASYFAELASDDLAVFKDEAIEAARSFRAERAQALYLTVAGSAVGGFLVILTGLMGWGFVKARYIRKLSKMKPEAD